MDESQFLQKWKRVFVRDVEQQSRNTLTLGRPESGIPAKEMCGRGFMLYNVQS